MATAMIYDTLKLAEQLEHEAGFDAVRARAMARILVETTDGNLVTREDLLATKGELEAAIHGLRLGGKIDALAGRIDRLLGRLHALCWMSAMTLAGVAAVWGIVIIVALHVMYVE